MLDTTAATTGQALHRLAVPTNGKGLTDITPPISHWVGRHGAGIGLLTLWCRHTSASLTVQENADPAVRADIARFFERLVPEAPPMPMVRKVRTTCPPICAPC